MLRLYESIPGTQIMSLRIGGPIAHIVAPIINPNNLYIEGWFVQDNRSHDTLVLLSQDIRDTIPQGFVVNDHEVLSDPKELIRLQEILELKFELLKLRVTSQNGTNYGKVSDFAFETKNFFVQKLYASKSIVKSLSGGTFSIDRSQIVEVTNRRIIIEDPTEEAKIQAVSPAVS